LSILSTFYSIGIQKHQQNLFNHKNQKPNCKKFNENKRTLYNHQTHKPKKHPNTKNTHKNSAKKQKQPLTPHKNHKTNKFTNIKTPKQPTTQLFQPLNTYFNESLHAFLTTLPFQLNEKKSNKHFLH